MTVTNEPGIGHLSVSTSRRLEILKEIESTFPGLPTEQVLDLARYVEGDGTPATTRAREFLKAGMSSPRKWTDLERIPDDVRAVTDPDGDVIRRVALGNRLVWKYEAARYEDVPIINAFAPFTEVLS